MYSIRTLVGLQLRSMHSPHAPVPFVRLLRTRVRSVIPTPHLAQLTAALASKDALVASLLASMHEQASLAASKDAQLASLVASKDAQQASLVASLLASKDAERANLVAFKDSQLEARELALAGALHEGDIANGLRNVRTTLEQVIAELWSKYGTDKTTAPSDRLRLLVKGACPDLVPYVSECAVANKLNPEKALEMLPVLYRLMSAPMHSPLMESEESIPIEAVLQGDASALLLVSCLFKLTFRDLRLYRMQKGKGRVDVVLKLKQVVFKSHTPPN